MKNKKANQPTTKGSKPFATQNKNQKQNKNTRNTKSASQLAQRDGLKASLEASSSLRLGPVSERSGKKSVQKI